MGESAYTKKTVHTKKNVYETFSPEETRALGRRLGENACPGEIYTLSGELGVGKTVFTQGIAEGLGITEPVTSPTFTIVQVYEEGRMPFYHFDVYRIGDLSEMDEEILPERRHAVRIEKDLQKGFDYRRITVSER